jgi:hypothetical protein
MRARITSLQRAELTVQLTKLVRVSCRGAPARLL